MILTNKYTFIRGEEPYDNEEVDKSSIEEIIEINEEETIVNEDSNSCFSHLHVHSQFSILHESRYRIII